MKKLIINTLAIFVLNVLVLDASSKNLSHSPIDLVEISTLSTTIINKTITPNNSYLTIYNSILSLEERKVVVKVTDNDDQTTASAVISFVNSSGIVIDGPYTVKEGEIFEKKMTERAFEIEIVSSTEGAIIEYWTQEL